MEQELRKCWYCNTEKELCSREFYRDKRNSKGYQGICKDCTKKRNKKYNVEHKEYFKQKGKERYKKEENPARYKRYQKQYLERIRAARKTPEGKLYDLFKAAADRSEKKGWECNITLEFLLELWNKQNGCCLLTGIPFTLLVSGEFNRRYSPFNPSLDRIDCYKGYTKDNVRLVCTMINLAMNQFGEETFREMCEAYLKHSSEKK